MEALWKAAVDTQGSYRPHLWLTVLALLYGTDLRRGELERLTVDSWDREQGLVRIDGRKTGCERLVPVPDLTRRCLEAYLPLRHNQLERIGRLDEQALLIGRDGNLLTAQSISNGVRRLAASAGISYVSVHQFRHSCASDLLEAGLSRFLCDRAILPSGGIPWLSRTRLWTSC